MNHNIFLYTIGFAIVALIVAVYLKRSWSISYDRKALVSILLAVLAVGGIQFLTDFNLKDWRSSQLDHKIYCTIIIFFVVNAVIQFLFWLIFSIIRYRKWVKMPRFLFNFFSFFILIGTILACIKLIFGIELTGLLVTSTVLSAIIGLALQDTLSSLFSGISLQIESPFNIDDWVNLGGFEGKVISQNWRTVTLLTRLNHRVSLTNKFVSEDKIVNFSRPTRRQIHNFYIVLDYSHPPYRIKKILEEMLNEIEEVKLDERLGVFVIDYLDSGIKYCLRYWLSDYADVLHIQDVVLSRMWYTLKRHNIKIPYPTSEMQLHVLKDLGTEKVDIGQEAILTFLEQLEWLEGMSKENLTELSNQCKTAIYTQDDLIVRQGEEGDSMFIIYTGGIKVLVKSEGRKEIEVARKSEGAFFGEMSLLTGQPRTASIKAIGDTKVIVIDKEIFKQLILSNEDLFAEFLEVLVACESGITDAIERERNNSNITKESAHKVIFNRIKDYFMIR